MAKPKQRGEEEKGGFVRIREGNNRRFGGEGRGHDKRHGKGHRGRTRKRA